MQILDYAGISDLAEASGHGAVSLFLDLAVLADLSFLGTISVSSFVLSSRESTVF